MGAARPSAGSVAPRCAGRPRDSRRSSATVCLVARRRRLPARAAHGGRALPPMGLVLRMAPALPAAPPRAAVQRRPNAARQPAPQPQRPVPARLARPAGLARVPRVLPALPHVRAPPPHAEPIARSPLASWPYCWMMLGLARLLCYALSEARRGAGLPRRMADAATVLASATESGMRYA